MPVTAVRPGKIWPAELKQLMASGHHLRLIDVREPDEVAEEAIPGSVNIPLAHLKRRLVELDPDEELIMVCRSGNRSAHACEIAAQAGYRVRNLEGGMIGWRR